MSAPVIEVSVKDEQTDESILEDVILDDDVWALPVEIEDGITINYKC